MDKLDKIKKMYDKFTWKTIQITDADGVILDPTKYLPKPWNAIYIREKITQ
jgi:hypothetical protein